MKKAFPVHPFLAGVFPTLSLYAANQGLIPLGDLWRPLALVFAGTVAYFLLGWLILRNPHRAAIGTTYSALVFFSYGHIQPILVEKVYKTLYFEPLDVWAIGVGIVLILLVWRAKNPEKWTPPLNVLGTVLVVLASGSIAWGLVKPFPEIHNVVAESTGTKAAPKHAPDIFFIVLDAYGRPDEVQRKMGFADYDFVKQLESRDFFVAKESRSNYCQTQLSLASTLNMSLLQDLIGPQYKNSDDRTVFDELVDNNAVAKFLRKRGYTYIAVTTGFPPFQFVHADTVYKQKISMNLFESLIVQTTPFMSDMNHILNMYAQRREMINAAFSRIHDLARPTTQPRFVIVHILAPHPPFVFGPNGEMRRANRFFTYADGTDFFKYGGTAEEYRKGYTEQMQYVNKMILSGIDALEAGSLTQPIIMIEGDHGSKVGLDQQSLEHTDVQECFENLYAMHAPGAIRKRLYDKITPVNSFRIVLSGLFGEEFKEAPNRSYYSTFDLPSNFYDVTEKLDEFAKSETHS